MSKPERVVIVGLGLMGGSLAQALKRSARPPYIAASTIEVGAGKRALGGGAVDEIIDDAATAFASADVIVYATPVQATLALLDLHAAVLRTCHAAVTDVGSVKVPVVTRARSHGLTRFVGAHPLCGAETSGYANARANLYDGACVYLIGAEDSAADEAVARLWRSVGADVEAIAAEAHDERMAWVSHLPQIVASALAATLAEKGVPHALLGPGGRGMVRLAASAPALWVEILRANRQFIEPALRAFTAELSRFEIAFTTEDDTRLMELLRQANVWRREGEA